MPREKDYFDDLPLQPHHDRLLLKQIYKRIVSTIPEKYQLIRESFNNYLYNKIFFETLIQYKYGLQFTYSSDGLADETIMRFKYAGGEIFNTQEFNAVLSKLLPADITEQYIKEKVVELLDSIRKIIALGEKRIYPDLHAIIEIRDRRIIGEVDLLSKQILSASLVTEFKLHLILDNIMHAKDMLPRQQELLPYTQSNVRGDIKQLFIENSALINCFFNKATNNLLATIIPGRGSTVISNYTDLIVNLIDILNTPSHRLEFANTINRVRVMSRAYSNNDSTALYLLREFVGVGNCKVNSLVFGEFSGSIRDYFFLSCIRRELSKNHPTESEIKLTVKKNERYIFYPFRIPKKDFIEYSLYPFFASIYVKMRAKYCDNKRYYDAFNESQISDTIGLMANKFLELVDRMGISSSVVKTNQHLDFKKFSAKIPEKALLAFYKFSEEILLSDPDLIDKIQPNIRKYTNTNSGNGASSSNANNNSNINSLNRSRTNSQREASLNLNR